MIKTIVLIIRLKDSFVKQRYGLRVSKVLKRLRESEIQPHGLDAVGEPGEDRRW